MYKSFRFIYGFLLFTCFLLIACKTGQEYDRYIFNSKGENALQFEQMSRDQDFVSPANYAIDQWIKLRIVVSKPSILDPPYLKKYLKNRAWSKTVRFGAQSISFGTGSTFKNVWNKD
jgi:hypothetical protein